METVVNELERGVTGRVLRPGSPSYSDALHTYSSVDESRPVAIVQCGDVADVAAGIDMARRSGLPLSLRGGAHSAAGLTLCDGIVLDFSGLRSVHVDPKRRTARAAAGATWRDYDVATQAHGLGSPGGVVSSTGVAGLTLGGGIGTLRGLHGLACDNLRSVDMVLADGSTVTADADREPDLFWALHGGGSNFGVVTSFEFDVHPVGRIVHGLLAFPIARAQEVAAIYRELADELPDECTVDLLFMRKPPAPGLLFGMNVRYVGDAAAAEETLRPLRSLGAAVDLIEEVSYCESQQLMDPILPWGHRHYWKTQTLRDLDEDFVAAAIEVVEAAPSPISKLIIEHLHGGVHRVAPEDTPIGFRHAGWNLMVVGEWEDAAADPENRAWADGVAQRMAPFAAGGAYTNYLAHDATQADVEAAHGSAAYGRLREIKRRYDPDNVFTCNQNISPA